MDKLKEIERVETAKNRQKWNVKLQQRFPMTEIHMTNPLIRMESALIKRYSIHFSSNISLANKKIGN